MKKLIAVVTIFAYMLPQCSKKSENASETIGTSKVAETAGTTSKALENVEKSQHHKVDELSIDSMKMDSAFLRMFYEEYVKGLERLSVDSIEKKYCTPRLIEKLQRLRSEKKLDYNPFINAQDFSDNILITLNIRRSDAPQGYYIVSYIDAYSQKNVYIVLSLTVQEGAYKISDVILGYKP